MALAILDARERQLAQTVIDGEGDKTERGEVDDVAGNATLSRSETGFIPFDPAAAVNDDDSRPSWAFG